MKRTISILTVLAFVLAFSGNTFAQSSDLSVTADVKAAINLTKNADVSFSTVQATSSPVIDPNGTNSDVGSGASHGKITVSAAASTQLVIDWDTDATLGDGSSATMTFTPDIDANSTDDAGTSGDVTKNTADSNTQTDGSGNLYIYVGGNLGSLSGQTTGTYSTANSNGGGPFTVTVNYQ